MRVAIVGLGQIGSSLGAALTRRGVHVTGIVRRGGIARRALAKKVAGRVTTDLAAVGDADVIVLATPVRTILAQLRPVASLLRGGAVLTDVGSTKVEIMRAARGLPFVGGHPMAGSEKAGLDGCDPDLFVQRPWFLVGRDARVERMVRRAGAKVIFMRADSHDRLVAEVSHLPHLAAYALMQVARDAGLAGRSFRDATRVAASDVDMVLDFLLTNPHLRSVANRYADRIRALAGAGEAGLRKALEAARKRRGRLSP